MLRVVTSHYFGQSYYCSPVWLNDALSHINWNRMRSQHYRALRAAFGDYKRKMSHDLLDRLSARATPRQWSYYITAKTAIGLYLKSDTRLAEDLRSNAFINDRAPGSATFSDLSRLKVGRNQFKNRLKHMSMLKFNWTNNPSDNFIRTQLKKTFFIF